VAKISRNGSQPHVFIEQVKVYARLSTAAIEANLSKSIRVWYIARALDQEGTGVIDSVLLRAAVDRYIGGNPRNQKRLLNHAEDNRLLKYRKGSKSYKLSGLERVAKILNTEVGHKPVYISVRHFSDLSKFKAECYAAYLKDVNNRSKPKSQRVHEEISGISKSAQSRYIKISKSIKSTRNIGIIRKPHRTHLDGIREHSKGAYFPLGDDIGQMLPSSHDVALEQAPRGMSRRVNKNIRRDLLTKEVRGHDKIFYEDDLKAERALRKENRPKAVYSRHSKPARSGAVVWEKQA
jgi:hypothetical protein|tara:strand:- start:292 stop:1170 length:879 start_codon:yes stop_codon:yes gene_type:complete